jgi:aerobic carbon-monoxide dehydrogenase medium subunit
LINCSFSGTVLRAQKKSSKVEDAVKPAPFNYERPTSIEAALNLLASTRGGAKIIAGGQSLVPMMNFRLAKPEMLIDINRIVGLDHCRVEGDELVIGALGRHAALGASQLVKETCPLMHEAYQWVAHGPVRNRGTLCGNLCHADPASELPAVVMVANAQLTLRSKAGPRRVPATEFFKGIYETASAEDEMLVEIRIPVAPKGQGWGFQEVCVRKGDFAIVAAAATLQIANGRVSRAAIGLCGVGACAIRISSAEGHLLDKPLDETTISEAAKLCVDAVDPKSDIHGSADYRRDLVRTLVARALRDARERCQ